MLAQGTVGRQRAAIVVTASTIILFCFLFYVAAQVQGAGITFTANFVIDRGKAIVLGGLGPLVEGLREVSTLDQLSWTAGNLDVLGTGFALGLMLIGLGSFGQPQLLNRFMALRDARALVQARVLAIGWFAVVLTGMLVLGWCGHLLLPDAADGETVFFQLTNDLLPVVIGGHVTAAVLSAIMSTADSQLLVAASAVAHDLGLARRAPRHALTASRVVMAVLTLVAVFVAIELPASILSRVLFAWNGLGAAFGPIVFARVLRRQVAPGAVLGAMLTGFGLTAVLYSLPDAPGDIA